MARKSRRNIGNAPVATASTESTEKMYHAALYARISSEDERKRECESMENQVKLLRNYVSSCEDISEYELYMDRAVTGTKFDRPEFNRMIADMRAGKFNCIIVKDLSRLGRNYLEAGNYLESIFPIFGIRFISITDHYDSLTAKKTEDGLIVPLKNLINEAYAKDISKKVKTSLDAMKRQGKYTGVKLPYGYKRDPQDKHHMIVDEAAAGVVVRIFEEKLAGKSVSGIASDLNGDGIPSPERYACENGLRKLKEGKMYIWRFSSVKRILENRCYTGDLVQGKTEKALYKGMDTTVKSADEYLVLEDAHEAIVSMEMFGRVQEMLERSGTEIKAKRQSQEPFEKPENLYDELFVCGDCGGKMGLRSHKIKGRRYPQYTCYTSVSFRKRCEGKCLYKNKLDRLVEEFLRQQISVYMGCLEKVRDINSTGERANELAGIQDEIRKMEEKVEGISVKIRNLYADFADGIINEEDYLFVKKAYTDEQETLMGKVSEMRRNADRLSDSYGGDARIADAFQKHSGFEVLTKEVVRDLIEKIVYYGKGRLEIKLKYADELQELVNEIGGLSDGDGK